MVERVNGMIEGNIKIDSKEDAIMMITSLMETFNITKDDLEY